MEFTFYKDELLRALKLLEPYVGHEQTELDSEPYFDDKVVFEFSDKSCRLSVCREDAHVHIEIPYFYGASNLTFCIQLAHLISVLEHINEQLLRFEEDTFFGFLVYSIWKEQKKFLFEIKAFSARKIRGYKVSNSSMIDIRKSVFESLLSELYQYTNYYDLSPCNKYIWFYGNGKEYMAIATDGHKLSYRRGETYIEESFSFAILGEEVPLLLNTLPDFGEILQLHMEYEYNSIYGYDKVTGTEINIIHFLPDISKRINLPKFILSIKTDCIHCASVCLCDITNAVNRICLAEYNTEVLLHFTNGHVNIHSYDEDIDLVTISEFYATWSNAEDFIVRQKARTLKLLLEHVNTVSVSFCVDAKGWLHVLNENETVFGESDRLACGCIIRDEETKAVERKDFELARDNKYYRELYFK